MKDLKNLGRVPAEMISIEQMPRSVWGRRRKRMLITHSIIYTPFGRMLIGSVDGGICFMGVMDEDDVCMGEMRARYPNAEFKRQTMPEHQNVRHFLMKDWKHVGKIRIYVRGTDFQMAVWQELLKIPVGKVSTYGEIARNIGRPRSLRPVGNAVGNNPVIYLIPCHRVICSSGKMGRFHWGVDLKLLLLNFESRSGSKIQGFFNWEPTLF